MSSLEAFRIKSGLLVVRTIMLSKLQQIADKYPDRDLTEEYERLEMLNDVAKMIRGYEEIYRTTEKENFSLNLKNQQLQREINELKLIIHNYQKNMKL